MSPDVVWLDNSFNMPTELDLSFTQARQLAFDLKLHGTERVWIVTRGRWDEVQLQGMML